MQQTILDFFSVSNIAIPIGDFGISYLELISTLLSVTAVILMARRNIWTYPIGIVASVLTLILLYQFQLYSNALEFLYYVGANIYGWLLWSSLKKENKTEIPVSYSSARHLWIGVAITFIAGVSWGFLMSRIHEILPGIFQAPAAFPYIDGLTTWFAFYAMWIQINRRIECWYFWIVVNIAYIVMYIVKDLNLYSGVMVVYLVIAVFGLIGWLKKYGDQQSEISD